MVKTIEILKLIQAYLLTHADRVYYEQAAKDAGYPHIVYDLPNSIDDGSMENFVLDVDGWDDSADTTALETLMDSIDGDGVIGNPSGLHRRTLAMSGEISVTFYRENRLTIHDPDKRLRRRKITYQARVHVPNT